jgi:hypothetical protein
VEDDRPAHLADLAGDDLAQMQGRAQLRLDAEALDEAVGIRSERRAHREVAAQRARVGDPSASIQVMTISSPTYW